MFKKIFEGFQYLSGTNLNLIFLLWNSYQSKLKAGRKRRLNFRFKLQLILNFRQKERFIRGKICFKTLYVFFLIF